MFVFVFVTLVPGLTGPRTQAAHLGASLGLAIRALWLQLVFPQLWDRASRYCCEQCRHERAHWTGPWVSLEGGPRREGSAA